MPEKTIGYAPLITLRDYIWKWIDETEADEGDECSSKGPVLGTRFSFVGNKDFRGGARRADWLISSKFYFWGYDIPRDIFVGDLSAGEKNNLLGELRAAMLCYEFSSNEKFNELSRQKVAERFQSTWRCPSTQGRSKSKDPKSVAAGIQSFWEAHESQLDQERFRSFAEVVLSETRLFDSIMGIVDETAQLEAYYQLIQTFVMRRRVTDDFGEGDFHLCALGLWDDAESVASLVDDLANALANDIMFRSYVDYFSSTTKSEMSSYLTSAMDFEKALSKGDEVATFQSILMASCTVPQLYAIVKTGGLPREQDDGGTLKRALKGVFGNRSLPLKRFLQWVSNRNTQKVPDWVVHKSNVIWNVVTGALINPRLCRPAPIKGVGTQVVSSIVEGSMLDDAIEAGSAPVSVFRISADCPRMVISSFDMGTRLDPRADGIVKILGRQDEAPDPSALGHALEGEVRQLFDDELSDSSEMLLYVQDVWSEPPVLLKYKGKMIPDRKAGDELFAELRDCALGILQKSREERSCGRGESKRHVAARTLVKAEIVDALIETAQQFFRRKRTYLRADLDAALEGFEEDKTLEQCPGGGDIPSRKTVQPNMQGIGEVKLYVSEYIDRYFSAFQEELYGSLKSATEEFCDREQASDTFHEIAIASIDMIATPDFEKAPREIAEGQYLGELIPAIVDTVRETRSAAFVELGYGDVDAGIDTSVSREQLAIRAENGRAVLCNLSKTSFSYIKNTVNGEASFCLFGPKEAQDRVAQWIVDSGYVSSLAGDRIVRVSDRDSVTLRRGDVIHMGNRTELELH